MIKRSRILIFFFLFMTLPALAAYNKNLWPLWEVNNPLSKETISHTAWQNFLDKRLITNNEGINLVDYSNLDEADKALLKNYITDLTRVQINNYNRDEQLAFWINLYNAVTVYTIANYYPIDSIEDINTSPGLFSIGPWGTKLVTINNRPLSLDEILNRIIRPIWNDSRIHYAINNGSIGAANLSKQAYLGGTIDEQLNTAALEYINSLRAVQIIEGKLILSKVYEWYREDFGVTRPNVIAHIRQFARGPLKQQLEHINKIENYVYNWHLNTTVEKSS